MAYQSCRHSLSTRTPRKQTFYRLLLTLVYDLLNTRFFLDWLKNVSYDYSSDFVDNDKYIFDVLDAPYFKQNLKEMHQLFQSKYRLPRATPQQKATVEVNLLFFFSYDGVKVRNRGESVFWPGFLTIANLPPTLRNRSGIGTFLILLNTVRNATVEADVIQHCYIAELKILLKGMECSIGGIDYFVQARLVHYAYDTKALEHMMCYSAMGYSGCPLCRCVPGVRLPQLEYPYYFGHRHLLPLTSQIRYHGQSRDCCPRNFYTDKVVHKLVGDNAAGSKSGKKPPSEWTSNEVKYTVLREGLTCSHEVYGGATADDEEEFEQILKNTRQRNFYHGAAIYEDLKSNLFYLHCDFRPHKSFSRIPHDEHMKVSREAAKTKKGIDGIKRPPVFADLPNFDIAKQSHYGGMHCLNGIFETIIGLLAGPTPTTTITLAAAKEKKLCAHFSLHPSLVDESSSRPDWQLSSNEKLKIDAHLDCFLVPVGSPEHVRPKNVFSRTGSLNCKTRISFLTHYLAYVLDIAGAELKESYLTFYSMFMIDIRELCENTIEIQYIPTLQEK